MSATVVGRVRVDRIVSQGNSKVGADWLFDFNVEGRESEFPSELPAGGQVTPGRELYATSLAADETRSVNVAIKATERDPSVNDEAEGGGTVVLDPRAAGPVTYTFPITVVEKGGSAAGAEVTLTFEISTRVDGARACGACDRPLADAETQRGDALAALFQLNTQVTSTTGYSTASGVCADATSTLSLAVEVWQLSAQVFGECLVNAKASAATLSASNRYLGQIDTAQSAVLAQAQTVSERAGIQASALANFYTLLVQQAQGALELRRLTADQRAGCRAADVVQAEIDAVKESLAQIDLFTDAAEAAFSTAGKSRAEAEAIYGRQLTARGKAVGKLQRLITRRKLTACLTPLMADDARVVSTADAVKATFAGFDAAIDAVMQSYSAGDAEIQTTIGGYQTLLNVYVDCVLGVITPP